MSDSPPKDPQPPLFGPERDVRTVLMDPPWDAESGGGAIKRGADRHYPLLSPREIVRVIQHECSPWQRVADTAHVWIWVTNATLTNGDAHVVARGLGLEPKTLFTWRKLTSTGKVAHGLGQYGFGSTEHLMLCRRGDFLPVRERRKTIFSAPLAEHSAKPEQSYELVEAVSHPHFLEIFARRERPGWTVWGNEV